MPKVNLSTPWVTYSRQIKALFSKDPEIKISYDDENLVLKLYVDNTEKAEALSKILPYEVAFGNVILKTEVIPANDLNDSMSELFRKAFKGNPIVKDIETVEGVFTNPLTYIAFENRVVQYWNDDLGDLNGLCSTLYQDIAKEVFSDCTGICFCTEKGEVEPVD